MILIINQHKGSIINLEAHLNNYLKMYKQDFYMIMVIDQKTTINERIDLVENYENQNQDKLRFIFNGNNLGLSQSRDIAVRYAINNNLLSKFTNVIFGCTNSKWEYYLDKSLSDDLGKYDIPCLIPCKYIKDLFNRDWDYTKKSINIESYINNDYRPDFTLMFPSKSLMDIQMVCGIEKYYPEEILLYECSPSRLVSVYDHPLQLAWYNDNGMSKQFSRKTMIENRSGFSKRAEVFLDAYLNNKMLLSSDKLKAYVYDYITLTPKVDVKHYQGTVIEPLLTWALNKWLTNKDYNHKITFIEDDSQY